MYVERKTQKKGGEDIGVKVKQNTPGPAVPYHLLTSVRYVRTYGGQPFHRKTLVVLPSLLMPFRVEYRQSFSPDLSTSYVRGRE